MFVKSGAVTALAPAAGIFRPRVRSTAARVAVRRSACRQPGETIVVNALIRGRAAVNLKPPSAVCPEVDGPAEVHVPQHRPSRRCIAGGVEPPRCPRGTCALTTRLALS